MLEYLMEINATVDGAEAASPRTGNVTLSRTDEMYYRLGALELAFETLVRLGVDRNLFTEEEFLAKAREIDAEDGVLDGRRDLSRMRKICPQCNKPNNGTKMTCMWCRADISQVDPVPNSI